MHGWPWAMTILTVLAWRQSCFALGVQSHLSQRLFTVYLHQPNTCRFIRVFRGYPGLPASPPPTESLPRTRSGGGGRGWGGLSAQLIHNVINEVNMFTGNGIQPGITLLTELLVALGLCSLLLLVEPLGALIVVSVLGTAAWGFHRLTRGRIARWGEARQHHEGVRIQHLQQGLQRHLAGYPAW